MTRLGLLLSLLLTGCSTHCGYIEEFTHSDTIIIKGQVYSGKAFWVCKTGSNYEVYKR